ncbi:MAG: M1 family aminopeptidase [Saprospiraceae bacterium]
MRNLFSSALIAALTLVFACTHKSAPKITAIPTPPEEPVAWDTIGKPVTGDDISETNPIIYDFEEPKAINSDSLLPYNPSHTKEVDLIHSKVAISFDWDQKRANGKVTLTMRPWFYETNEVTLDAKNFDIKSVTLEGSNTQLPYDYNNEKLVVRLGKKYTRKDEFKLNIEYTAKPYERTVGGSSAITSDRGLFFINADGTDAKKPKQIWTQGETENNSCWMPTIDKPNERCTQEMYITVEDKFKTLSNGLLVSSTKNADGTRTDYWKMDKPHAPYLFMMAIGEFAVVKDKWRGIDVDYYVEPTYGPDARAIYPYTTEMLEFFSNKLNYPYPWPKFSQVIVRDYVSGAMENTTAVIFGEFMQKTKRELMDDGQTNELVVAHEMFHHWFGDLVTTESWANLTLNEGFANYSEYLWLENKHGKETADFHLLNEQEGYFQSAGDGGHPLIHFGYGDKEDMFDSHSYNKGGCILHMLRQELGDDAFFAGLNYYLKKNEYSEVEADELRLAFEEVTGRDLNWFFNQWFFASGHPDLTISYNWDETAKVATVYIVQNQVGDETPHVFDLPMLVDIYDENGKSSRQQIRMTMRTQSFQFPLNEKPALINVDATKTLLCRRTDNHSEQEWAFQYRHAPEFRDRWDALDYFMNESSDLANDIIREAFKDPSAEIRQRALSSGLDYNEADIAAIEKMASNDPDHHVRATCISMLGELEDPKYVPIYEKGLGSDQAYSVVNASITSLYRTNPSAAIEKAKILEEDDSDAFIQILTTLYAEEPSMDKLPYFDKKLETVDGFPCFPFFQNYQSFLIGLDDQEVLKTAVAKIKSIAMNEKNSEWRRFAATKCIADIRNAQRGKGMAAEVSELEKTLQEIRDHETDPMLKQYYDGF